MELANDNLSQRHDAGSQLQNGQHSSEVHPLRCNAKEKIILLVDTSYEMSLQFPAGQNRSRTSTRLEYIKKALDIFLHSKSLMNPLHEYALIVLQDDVVICYQEFTRNVQLLLDIIYDLEPMEVPSNNNEFSLDPILEQIDSLCQLPVVRDQEHESPSHVVRAILLFGRSQSEMTASESMQERYESLQDSPYFFFDVLYIFDETEEQTIVKENFSFLQEMNRHRKYYLFEATSKATDIFESLAKILAHPLQRCQQHEADYSFMPTVNDAAFQSSDHVTIC